MKKQYANPKELNVPRFYTHTVSVAGATKLVTISGQVSRDASGNVVGKGDMRAQSEQVFKNVLKGSALPASTLVGVAALVHPDLLLEVEVVAAT